MGKQGAQMTSSSQRSGWQASSYRVLWSLVLKQAGMWTCEPRRTDQHSTSRWTVWGWSSCSVGVLSLNRSNDIWHSSMKTFKIYQMQNGIFYRPVSTLTHRNIIILLVKDKRSWPPIVWKVTQRMMKVIWIVLTTVWFADDKDPDRVVKMKTCKKRKWRTFRLLKFQSKSCKEFQSNKFGEQIGKWCCLPNSEKEYRVWTHSINPNCFLFCHQSDSLLYHYHSSLLSPSDLCIIKACVHTHTHMIMEIIS